MSAVCLLCSVSAAESSRLCDSHSTMWTNSHERRRAMAGPGGEHANSMFTDFVVRMRLEIGLGLGIAKHVDCDCMSCRPP